jgi:putative membrane-bound dehydrogenase-like protein
MRTLLLLCVPVLFGAAPPGGESVRLNGHTFTLPRGFTIELATTPGLVKRPVAATFDDEGNLYVTEASGTNDPTAKQLKDRPHRLLKLTAKGGLFTKATVFANKLMLPQGVMWKDGSVYVGTPPSIWKLTDTTGKGVADKREEWFNGKTLTGCANDLHGPYFGPDGWIYWTKGAFAEQRYKRPGKPDLVTRASHIFRARPDGSGIEPVMTGGMDNPVDVVFTPSGERIFTTTFLQHPAGGLRDGLLHAVYGGVYGKQHGVIDGHVRTSPHLMPVMTHLGAAAPCGLHRYESSAFGRDYKDNLFACLFNMQKVTRHVLKPKGATFETFDTDFVVSDRHDFHPTDVIEDADGSLLIIDTGGWYKLCCPTSQLPRPDVLGAIYRVRKKGMAHLDDPRGKKLEWVKAGPKELVERFADARPAVRWRAIEALGKMGPKALPALKRCGHVQAVWAACRIEGEEARGFICGKLAAKDATVRQAAIHAVSLWRDGKAVPELLRVLKERGPAEQRAAAEALGRVGNAKCVSALVDLANKAACPILRHSAIYALIEIGDEKELASRARTSSAALVALDQIGSKELRAEAVIDNLSGRNGETAWWIVSRHPEWATKMAEVFREGLAGKEAGVILQRLPTFASSPIIQKLLAERLREGKPAEKRRVLEAMAAARLKALPEAWGKAVAEALAGKDNEVVLAALALPASAHTKDALARLADDEKRPAFVRLSAFQGGPMSAKLFRLALAQLSPDEDALARSRAVAVLVKAALAPEQRLGLARSLSSTGPMELSRLLDVFAKTTEEKLGLAVVAAVRKSPVRAALRPDQLRTALAKQPASVQKELTSLIAELDAGAAQQRAELEKLATSLGKGDIRRGQAVFNSKKTACISCHSMGYLGGKVGPDLTRIGRIRTERDLLESIVLPSASFVRSYEPVSVRTVAGITHNGILKNETPTHVVLTISATEEVTVRRADIESMQPGKVSVMPAGMDKVLTRQELADLVAFLRACR